MKKNDESDPLFLHTANNFVTLYSAIIPILIFNSSVLRENVSL